jgi:hypothetical protein
MIVPLSRGEKESVWRQWDHRGVGGDDVGLREGRMERCDTSCLGAEAGGSTICSSSWSL